VSKENQVTPYEGGQGVSMYDSTAAFDHAQRMATALSKSTLVPAIYRDGQTGIANTLIALDIASRLKASPLEIMQSMNIIDARPSFSSKFLAGRLAMYGYDFDYETEDLGIKKIELVTWTGPKGDKKRNVVTKDIHDCRCRIVAKYNGKTLIGTWVSFEMAWKEGWFTKPGSKWPSMPDQMLRYRAVSFFISAFASHLTMGIPSSEEAKDSIIIRQQSQESNYEALQAEFTPSTDVTPEPEPEDTTTEFEPDAESTEDGEDLI
jgi:hypothetical protein